MEQLKPLDQLQAPDPRLGYFGFKLDYLHRYADALKISASAPRPVQDQFMIAKNALVYSWYVYTFLPIAILYSVLAVEQALYLRAKPVRPAMFNTDREPTLRPLLLVAIQERWITDAGFDVEAPDVASLPEWLTKKHPNIADDQRYCYSLLDSLVSHRNHLAHGEYVGPVPSAIATMARGVELINQLYPTAETAHGASN